MAVAIPFIIMAGAAMSAVSAIKQGQAAKAAAQFNANIAKQNVDITHTQTAAQLAQQDREQYLRIGAIKAAQGKDGGKASEGSVLDVLADTAAQGEIARQQIAYRGALQERGYKNTATLDTFEGNAAMQSANLRAGGELLQGAGKAYGEMSRV